MMECLYGTFMGEIKAEINSIKEMINELKSDHKEVDKKITGKKVITDDRLIDRFQPLAQEVISYQSANFELGDILSEIAIEKLKTEDGNWAKVLPLYIQPPPVTLKK